MMVKQSFPCPKCASMRTELRDFPEQSRLHGLVQKLLRTFAGGRHVLRGHKVLVCKDCGNKSLIQIM